MIKYLITGTGRCGTVYLARLLTMLGLPCGHEAIFTKDQGFEKNLKSYHGRRLSYCSTHEIGNGHVKIEPWVNVKELVAESSYLMTTHLDAVPDIPLIHIVRDPLKVISSFLLDLSYFKKQSAEINPLDWERRIYDFLPELDDIGTNIERACYFYVKWNRAIEKQKGKRPYCFAQVETILTNMAFFDFIKCEPISLELSNTINTFGIRKCDMDLDQIPDGDIKNDFTAMVTEYGYACH